MRIVIQRVKEAHVIVAGETVGQIGVGLLVFLGVAKDDETKDADYLIEKLLQLRIFDDAQGKMNLSAFQVNAACLIVSQFTLLGSCDKGRRPSFDGAADPTKAEGLYDYFVNKLKAQCPQVSTGIFRALMEVHLVNDGPVTFVVDSK